MNKTHVLIVYHTSGIDAALIVSLSSARQASRQTQHETPERFREGPEAGHRQGSNVQRQRQDGGDRRPTAQDTAAQHAGGEFQTLQEFVLQTGHLFASTSAFCFRQF